MAESEAEELERLRRENTAAGDLISEIARVLGSFSSSRKDILAKIARLQDKASRTDMTPSEGRSASILRQVATVLDAQGIDGLILDKGLISVARDRMREIRGLRLVRSPSIKR